MSGRQVLSSSKSSARTSVHDSFSIQGHVRRGFEIVGDAFAENFILRRELGGACCAFVRGEKVVDLWGGIRNKQTDEPGEQDTMVVIHSATKCGDSGFVSRAAGCGLSGHCPIGSLRHGNH